MKRTPIVALDHISVNVRRFKRAREFYRAALGAIGMKINLEFSSALGLGSKKEKVFWLVRDLGASGGGHYAFRVRYREEVDAFHAAALAAGGTDNGAPGLRPMYHPNYYGAYVLTADGVNLEAVCHVPE